MDHRDARASLTAYLDGTLPAADRARIDDHLAACADCRAELDDLRHLIGLLQAVPPAEPPRSFVLTPDLIRRAPAPAPPEEKVRWLRPVRYLTAVAALFLVALIARDAFDVVNQGGIPAAAPAAAPSVKTVASSASQSKEAGIMSPTPTSIVAGATVNRTPQPDAPPSPPAQAAPAGARLSLPFGPLEWLLAVIVIAGGLAWLAGARREAARRNVR